MDRSDIDGLAKRLSLLELENRRLASRVRWLSRGVALAVAVPLLALLAWPRLAGVPLSLHAEQFVLHGPDGSVRAVLGMKPGPPRVNFLDMTLAWLGYRTPPVTVSGVFGPTLRVFDEAGKQRVALGLNMETGGVPFLTFADAAELDRLAVYTMADGGTTLHLRDGSSKDRLSIGATSQGHGIMSIQDGQGNYRFLAPPPPPSMSVQDEQGIYRPVVPKPAPAP